MKQTRHTTMTLVLAIVISAVLTLFLLAAALVLLLGKNGMAMAESMLLINTQFVGGQDLDETTDAALSALARGLDDRWSYYVDAEGYKNLQERQKNAYVGIGCTVDYRGEAGAYIVSVVAGGPAEQAGVQAGDTLLGVDGKQLSGEDRTKAAEWIKGPVGTDVTLLLQRGDREDTVIVTRARVEEHPVSYKLLEDNTGLVTIKNFNRRSAKEAKAAVADLIAQGAPRLVFDVRDNGGGYLDELTHLLDYLLPEGVIFRSESNAGFQSQVTSDKDCVPLPMAVLVNGETYSAAEFFAAQLQEMDWAVVVGTATFGKGYSQQTFPLPNGGALNISTAKYFTGGGTSLIGTGVTLDREVQPIEGGADPQLQTAIEMIK